jgi:ligand-binding sensor domain-containing protein
MKMYRFFLIVITLLFTFAANALEITRAKYEHFTVDEGLSQNNVEAIFQDSQGYIWIGTQNGLNKYNGLYFQTYLHESTDSNSLASSWINAIAEDKNGLIWIGSDGLNYYNPLLDKMVRIVEDAENEQAFHGGKSL